MKKNRVSAGGQAQELLQEQVLPTLRALGLSSYAGQAYLALIKKAESTAGALCNETGIHDSKIYYALEELVEKNLVGVQFGTPNVYRALHPQEAFENLRKSLLEKQTRVFKETERLASKLAVIYKGGQAEEKVGLAYVVKGRRGVLSRLAALIESAERKLTFLAPDTTVLETLLPTLKQAHHRGVQLRLAVAAEEEKLKAIRQLGEVKRLGCPCFLLINDDRTLITVAGWPSERCSAILTDDPNLTLISEGYYQSCAYPI